MPPLTPSEPLDGQEDDLTDVTVTPAPAPESGEITIHTPPPVAPPSRDLDLEQGSTLGEYRVDSKIGEGGMGMVFSAIHPVIGKRAAIKVLRKELCEDPITLERFMDEARVVNQIGHPNIVDVFAFGRLPDGRSYFVMEWLKGESLRARIHRARVGYLEAFAILRSLARALEAAHEKGVVHRDLKPDNVFLVEERDEMPRVKLLDFGIAKLVREEHQVARTATGAMVGTPQYVAPEQAKGHAIDHRVDIYSLGCIAFELFTGRPPFVADNAMEMVAKHLMEPPPRPRKLDSSIPSELDALILEMLAKDREERPTLVEVTNVLERLAQRPAPRAGRKRKHDSVASSLAVTRAHAIPGLPRPTVIAFAIAGAVGMAVLAFVLVKSLSSSDKSAAQEPAVQEPAATLDAASMVEPIPPPPPGQPAPAPVPTTTEIPVPARTAPAAPPHRPRPVVVRPPVHTTRVAPDKPPQPPTKPAPPAPPPDDDDGLMRPGTIKR